MPGEPDEVVPMFRAESIVDGDAPDSDASRLCSPPRTGCLPLSTLTRKRQLRRRYSHISSGFNLLRSALPAAVVGMRLHFSFFQVQRLHA